MILPPRARNLVLVAHITTSVGWLGAVAAYLALDVVAAASQNAQQVRAAYVGMDLIVTYVIVPLALASVVVGVVTSWGSRWGLMRHYWVVTKLVLTVVAAIVLLLEAPTVRDLAESSTAADDPRGLGNSLAHSIGGAMLLLLTVILSVYKPRGLTRYGWRQQHDA